MDDEGIEVDFLLALQEEQSPFLSGFSHGAEEDAFHAEVAEEGREVARKFVDVVHGEVEVGKSLFIERIEEGRFDAGAQFAKA